MKNNNIQKVILLSFLVVTVASCNKNLDLSPISSYNAANFYKTQNDFNLAVNGLYDKVQSLFFYSDYPNCIESRGDNVNTDTQYDAGNICKFIDNETTTSISEMWQYYFQLIDRSNAILDNIDNATFTSEDYRKFYKGEAFFMRGYAYSQLGYLFGGVPLLDKQKSAEEIKSIARSTQNETFSFAAKDFIQAASLLPTTWPSATELGKATKYAAEGMLARLYLFQKNFASAKLLLSDIISSGKYNMATNYADCFLDKYDNSQEHVFQVQYKSGNVGEGNILPVIWVPEPILSSMFPQGGSAQFLRVSSDLYDSYATGDIRRDFNIQKGYTNKSGVVDVVTKFYIKYGHGSIPATKDDYEVNLPVLRFTDVKLMYAECLNEEVYNGNGEAIAILNDVRSRAGLTTALTAKNVPDQASFRKAIFNERRWEFAGEFLRWFDLVRSGNAFSIMNTYLQRAENGTTLYKMKETQTIFAIPQYELLINPNKKIMWQNPGY